MIKRQDEEVTKIFVSETPIDREKFVFPDSAVVQFEEARKHMAKGEHENAKENLRLAASDKHPAAIHELGCYLQLEKEYAESRVFFQEAADMGFSPSIYNLAIYYYMGMGTEADKQKAFSLYKRAAQLGHARAQYHLGNLYQDGDGIEKNNKKAFKWFQRSASQDDPYAPLSIGLCYLRGIEGVVEKDEKKSKRLDRKKCCC